MKKTYIPREMLCGHFADIYLQGYMSAPYPSWIFTSVEAASAITFEQASLEFASGSFHVVDSLFYGVELAIIVIR